MLPILRRRRAHALLLSLALWTAGCGVSQDEAAPEDARQRVLSVAGVFPTPIDEPWPQVVDRAFRELAESGRIEYEAEYGVGERFLEVLGRAAAGHDIVVADTYAAEEAARRIAGEHPETSFFFGSALGPTAPNVSVFDSWLHEAAYLAGLVAGSASRSGRLGVVAANPGPETNRMLNAFLLGAREVAPSSCLDVHYTGSWFDPSAARAAGRQLIDRGADVLYAERLGAEQAAAEAGVPVIGNFLDQRSKAPEVTLTSVLWSLRPAVEHLLRRVEHERFSDHAPAPLRIEDVGSFSSLAAGGSALAPFSGPALEKDALERLEARETAIRRGLFRVPIVELEVAACDAP